MQRKYFVPEMGQSADLRCIRINGAFRQPKHNHLNGLSWIGISMRRAHVKPCFATVALLGAFLPAQHLRAGQNSLEKAESLLSKGATAEAVVVLRQIVADDRRNVDAHLLLGTALGLIGIMGNTSTRWP